MYCNIGRVAVRVNIFDGVMGPEESLSLFLTLKRVLCKKEAACEKETNFACDYFRISYHMFRVNTYLKDMAKPV